MFNQNIIIVTKLALNGLQNVGIFFVQNVAMRCLKIVQGGETGTTGLGRIVLSPRSGSELDVGVAFPDGNQERSESRV